MITRTNGNAWLTTTQPVAAEARRPRWRAITYAIGVAITTAIRAAETAAISELAAAWSSGCSSNACRKLSRVGCSGIQVGCSEPSSRAGLNAVEISHTNGNARKTRYARSATYCPARAARPVRSPVDSRPVAPRFIGPRFIGPPLP